MVEMIEMIQDPKLRSQVEIVAFYGYLRPKALVGIQMLNTARRVLRLSLDGVVFVASETFKLPADPFPILAKATGNRDLQIEDPGKMAATVNKIGLAGNRTTAMRIFLHLAKTLRYPTLHAWFMKCCKVSLPGGRLQTLGDLARASIPGNLWRRRS